MKTGFYHIPRNASLKDRFEASFIPEPNSGCWLWVGAATTHRGFTRGVISVCNTSQYASRVSRQLHVGPIPAGLLVCHLCNNPLCVNPEHLYVGTHQDNMNDKMRAGRHVARRSARERICNLANCEHAHCMNGHDLVNAYFRPNGRWIECRECRRIESARRRLHNHLAA